MNGLDIAILVILGAFILKGLVRGLLKELCSLLGLGAGAFLAFRFYAPLSESIARSLKLPHGVCATVSFCALFLATILFFAVLGYLLSRFVKLLFLGGANRVAGGLFGLVQGVLVLALVLFALSLRAPPKTFRPLMERSHFFSPFAHLGEAVFQGSRNTFPGLR
jgi:membrane protein required for colicin V production